MNDLSGLRFRSSLNGFRKKDVSQYIDALSRNAAAEKAGLEDALAELMEMTGEKVSDEVVDRIFNNFCVGK